MAPDYFSVEVFLNLLLVIDPIEYFKNSETPTPPKC